MYQIRRLNLMGISYNPIFRAFNGRFVVTPTTTVSPKMGAPGASSGGLSPLLIGDLPFLESFPTIGRKAQ